MTTKKQTTTILNPDVRRVDGIGKRADVHHHTQGTGPVCLRRKRPDDAGRRMRNPSCGDWRNIARDQEREAASPSLSYSE